MEFWYIHSLSSTVLKTALVYVLVQFISTNSETLFILLPVFDLAPLYDE